MATNDLMVSDSLKGLFDEEPSQQSLSHILLISPISGKINRISRTREGIRYTIVPDNPMEAFEIFERNIVECLIFSYGNLQINHKIIDPLISIEDSYGKITIQIESRNET